MYVAQASVSGHNLLTVAHTCVRMAETHHLWPTLIAACESWFKLSLYQGLITATQFSPVCQQ